MKIIGFSCCVNYSDMLALTYPFNKYFFDDYIVSTSNDDFDTISYCQNNDITFITSNSYKKNGAAFNKAAMLNEALRYIHKFKSNDNWYVSLDSDIIVDAPNFNKEMCLNKDWIYGSKRKIIDSKSYFDNGISKDIIRNPNISWEQNLSFNFPHAQVGYFQMFKKKCLFDEKYLTASDCDTEFFYDNFSTDKSETFRANELMCYHLGPIESNWEGRKTESWGNIKCVI